MKNVVFLSLFAILTATAAVNVPLTISEALYPGSVSGVSRANDPVTLGVPLVQGAVPCGGSGPAVCTGLSSLTISGASAGQFRCLGVWSDNSCKWVKISTLASPAAGGSASVTLASGAGNFGGSNLATDNGGTITVATGAATFTIKKANFNVLDAVDVGGTQLVLSGSSAGLVLLGPDPTKVYPATVTCSTDGADHPGVSSLCTTAYQSSNDPSSTAVIEENGPVMTVIKADGNLMDNAANTYLHYTVRLYFWKNKTYVKPVVVLRNADYGSNNTFASAYKGYQGLEIRLAANLSGTLNYAFGNHTTSPTTGTISGANSAYLYVAETNALKAGQSATSWCVGYGGCVMPTSLTGYVIMNNGTAVVTGSASQFPQGWASIQNATGVGIEIGQYQMASYGNKSLEFRAGGSDVRIGLWASENNSTSLSSTTANTAYYIPWPQHDIQEAWINFYTSAPASPANEFLKYQHYLVGRASVSYYNSTNVFQYPLLDPVEEDSYYAAMVASASPSVPSYTAHDQGTTTGPWLLKFWRYYPWGQGGGNNQMEFRLSYLQNFLRRGYTGQYLEAASFYKMQAERTFPMSDGFDWRAKPSSETELASYPVGLAYPTAGVANFSLGMSDPLDISSGGGHLASPEHAHWYGMPDFYFLSGDETIKDVITDAVVDYYLDVNSSNNLITNGKVWNSRAAGNVLMGTARLYDFLRAVGDSNANAVLARGNTTWTLQIKPELCVSGYPSGCTQGGFADTFPGARGTSFTRGIPYQFSQGIQQSGGCSATGRAAAPFQTSILLQGMWEYRKMQGSTWADYTPMLDWMYGMAQWALNEGYFDNGTSSYSANGYRYYISLDYANACDTFDYPPSGRETVYYPFLTMQQYLGAGAWTNTYRRKFQQVMQKNQAGQGIDENFHYTIANVIYQDLHPDVPATLTTLPVTNFVDNGGGSYTLTWTVPSSASSYRIKWGRKAIVDWIGFDAGSNVFIGDPATTMNWFAATDALNVSTPSGTSQSMTISTGTTGLTAANFMIKAYVGGGGTVSVDTTPPSVSISSPTAGTTQTGTVTLMASATDNVAVANVQFKVDGVNLGAPVTGGGPTYSAPWDTRTASNGSHVLTAVATDTSGNAATSAAVSVSVNNGVSADFTASILTASQSVSAGSSATYSLNITAVGSFTGAVTFAASGLPSGIAASFSPTSVSGSGAAVMTLATATTVAGGSYSVTVTATSGSLIHTTPVTLTVTAQTGPSGAGSPLGVNNWTKLKPHGPPVEVLGYDKSIYVSSKAIHCVWGSYHQVLTSELQQATVCYSYRENRWIVLQNNGVWHNDHDPGAGHTSSIWAYMPDRDSIAFMTDGSGSSAYEKFLTHWWWIDVAGLSGQDRTFTPKPWVGVVTPATAMAYDSANSKLVMFPDATGVVQVCDPTTNSCQAPKTSGTAPGNMANLSLVYNTRDQQVYVFGGGQNDVYKFNVATNVWTKLVTTCTGADCVSGKPPARQAGGAAYSTADNVFLIAGGVNGTLGNGTALTDTWIFDPTNSAWTEQSPATRYSNNSTNATFDRVSYDEDSNVFLLMASGGNGYADGSWPGYAVEMWGYAYSPALNYERITNTYTPTTGSLNRLSPTASSQSWAFEPSLAASGSVLYAGWLETGAPFDTGNCGMPHPYIQSSPNSTTWTGLPGGSQSAACTAIDPEPAANPAGTSDSKLKLGVVNGTPWEIHERWGGGFVSAAWAKSWNGSAWTGGQLGCFSAPCSSTTFQYPQGIIGIGPTPTALVIEENHVPFTSEGYVYVAQSTGAGWVALGGKLNVNTTGTRALSAAIESDGTNPAVCWAEEVDASRAVVTTTPQIYCSSWSGTAWTRFGSSSLNRTASSWASSPSLTYAGGKFYIGWTERTTAGPNRVYVCRWDGTSCTLLGGGPLNINGSTGWAAHPSLSNDGTNVYVAWEEQSVQGQPSLGYVKKWDGSTWTQLGGALNANAGSGSVAGITLAVAQGIPSAIWSELSYGNMRQIYLKTWDGTTWTGASGSGSGTPSPSATLTCDLNGDGKIDSLDVQLAINQALGMSPCTSADLQQTGTCSVVGVQRVINASLGGACKIGN
jgi:hypothetical protein